MALSANGFYFRGHDFFRALPRSVAQPATRLTFSTSGFLLHSRSTILAKRYARLDYVSLSWLGSLRFHFDDPQLDCSLWSVGTPEALRQFAAHGVPLRGASALKAYLSYYFASALLVSVGGLLVFVPSALAGDGPTAHDLRSFLVYQGLLLLSVPIRYVLDRGEENDRRASWRAGRTTQPNQ